MNDQTKAEISPVRPGQRIAKVMARAGICSRRDAEAWIADGRVSVNGEVLLRPAFNVSDEDDVRVDGKRLGAAERTRLFLFHKPRGFVTTARDPEGRPTVFDALPAGLPRVIAVGRLDINTEGLLLLTNDGGLARVLELPSTGWLRRYRVRAHGTIDQAALDRLSGGIAIDGVDYLGIEARLDREQGSNVWITLGLREGKNREIKKVLEHLGLAVNRLIRVSFGPFELGDLAEREAAEVRTRVLRDQLGAKLAKEAQANFDAPLIARDAPTPTKPSGDVRSPPRTSAAHQHPGRKPGRDDARRDGEERERRFDPDAPARRSTPARSTPERRRKHVSRLGRRSPLMRRRPGSGSSAAPPTTARGGPSRSNAFPLPAKRRGGAPMLKVGSRARDVPRQTSATARERERPPRTDKAEGGRRPEFEQRRKAAGRHEGGPRERASERPQGRKTDRVGESRPLRADAKDRGPRSEFKARGSRAQAGEGAPRARRFDRPSDQHRGKREFDRPHGYGRETGAAAGAPRVRSPRPHGPPGKGPPRGRGGPRRPLREP